VLPRPTVGHYGDGTARVLKEIVGTQQTVTPHLQAANTTYAKMIALLREVEDEQSGLSADQRDARRREIDVLMEQVRSEHEAIHRAGDGLKTRYPRWVK